MRRGGGGEYEGLRFVKNKTEQNCVPSFSLGTVFDKTSDNFSELFQQIFKKVNLKYAQSDARISDEVYFKIA